MENESTELLREIRDLLRQQVAAEQAWAEQAEQHNQQLDAERREFDRRTQQRDIEYEEYERQQDRRWRMYVMIYFAALGIRAFRVNATR